MAVKKLKRVTTTQTPPIRRAWTKPEAPTPEEKTLTPVKRKVRGKWVQSKIGSGMLGYHDFSHCFNDPGEICQVMFTDRTVYVDIRRIEKRAGGVSLWFSGTTDEMIDWLVKHRDTFREVVG